MTISARAEAWARQRGISRTTLARLPVASGMVWFPDLNRRTEGLFFRYQEGWKARSLDEKSFVAGGGFKASFWNLGAVLQAAPIDVFCTEGETDAIALVEAGIPANQVLSVPTGARIRAAEDPKESRGYGYVTEALACPGLANVKRFIWCGDADEPGLILRDDMVRVIGPARFWSVSWPEGINDPNEMLTKEGPEALRELITQGATPWPQEGLYRFSEIPDAPAMTLWAPALDCLAGKVALAPKTLVVVTGQPGHGKTSLFGEIIFGIAQKYDLVCCVAAFETRPKPHMRRQLRTLLTGRLEIEMTEAEQRQADAWIEDHYVFINHPEQRPTLTWLLDCAETAVVRYGAKILQIDPWNRLEGQRDRGENETDYILRCLREMYNFAQDMGVHFQIVAHPAKMHDIRRGKPPELEDVSGSKHWENLCDQGFVIHRPKLYDGPDRKTEAVLYHKKARFEELGYPCSVYLNYDLAQRRYVPLYNPDEVFDK